MESKAAAASLSALAHEGRLSVFRLLVQSGPEGLAAGEIARRLNVRPSSLSANLNVLSHVGLLRSQRDGRSIRYAADFSVMSALIRFLLADCCDGAPEVCRPVADALSATACFQPSAGCA